MTLYLPFLAFVFSVACGFVFIPQVLNYCKRKNLYDIPNERKVHKNAIPRMGGISFMPSMLVSCIVALLVYNVVADKEKMLFSQWSVTFFVSLLIIYVVGIVDDLLGVSARTKLVCQIIAGLLLTSAGLYINNLYGLFGINELPSWAGIPLTVFIIVLIDNAMNMIDGIDGLAGSLALFALLGFMVVFHREGLWVYSTLIAGLAGVLVPFLYFNVFGDAGRNRKIFMGDSGSLMLGFVLAFLFVKFVMNNPNVMPFRRDGMLLSISLLVVPVFDVLRVVLVRLRERKPLFKADKNHLHHKLMSAGLTQHQALTVIMLLAAGFVLVNILMLKVLGCSASAILMADIVLHILFHWAVSRRIKRIRTA